MGARHFRRRLLILSVSTLGFFISSFSDVLASDFTGPVVSVLDGGTIEVLHNTPPERIRLSGIDCPEKGQAFGTRAKQAASALVHGKEVTLQTYGLDKYGRTIADVLLPDGTNVNHELVKDGWCWWYQIYAPGNRELAKLEKHVRQAKQGLWVNPPHAPPVAVAEENPLRLPMEWIQRAIGRARSYPRESAKVLADMIQSQPRADAYGDSRAYQTYRSVFNFCQTISQSPCPNFCILRRAWCPNWPPAE